jgi:hypothetical protein
MTLRRLTRERYATMRDRGEFPNMQAEPSAPVAVDPEPLTRGGTPQHPTWPRVIALVRNQQGMVNHDFVAEASTVRDAILLASRYPYRAQVISRSGKREFDNGKAIEAGEVTF